MKLIASLIIALLSLNLYAASDKVILESLLKNSWETLNKILPYRNGGGDWLNRVENSLLYLKGSDDYQLCKNPDIFNSAFNHKKIENACNSFKKRLAAIDQRHPQDLRSVAKQSNEKFKSIVDTFGINNSYHVGDEILAAQPDLLELRLIVENQKFEYAQIDLLNNFSIDERLKAIKLERVRIQALEDDLESINRELLRTVVKLGQMLDTLFP